MTSEKVLDTLDVPVLDVAMFLSRLLLSCLVLALIDAAGGSGGGISCLSAMALDEEKIRGKTVEARLIL